MKRAGFALQQIDTLSDWPAFESLLASPGPWIGGFDFPFGLPAEAVVDLGWPQIWPEMVRYCAALGRDRFREILDRYRESRAVGSRYAHRATDHAAHSHSPLKLVNPPVGLMFIEGAPRLLAAGVSVAALHQGDPERVAFEAYPGLAARAITTASYKSDERAKQTRQRTAARKRIVAALVEIGGPFGFRLQADTRQRRDLVKDPSGDRLDAVLAAMQAGWAFRRRAQNFGLPANIHPLEGWILMASGNMAPSTQTRAQRQHDHDEHTRHYPRPR